MRWWNDLPVLEHQNLYTAWAMVMEAHLTSEGLWGYVTGAAWVYEKNSKNYAEWMKGDAKAKMILFRAVDETCLKGLSEVLDRPTAREVWDWLAEQIGGVEFN